MTQGCDFQACPINCKVSAWSDLTPCSKVCGGGTSTRARTVLVSNAYGGYPCPHLLEQASCNNDKCPTSYCNPIGAWSSWTACSASCGTGQMFRSRHAASRPLKTIGSKKLGEQIEWTSDLRPSTSGWFDDNYHRVPTCEALEERKTCSNAMCPIDCKASAWSEWQPCSKSCGTGVTKRFRSELVAAAFGGTKCGRLTQLQACEEKPCPVDCISGDWDAWSRCTATCGTGQQSRTRQVVRQAAYGGLLCKASNERRFCNTFDCPVDCQVGGWGAWDTCSQQCGGGQQKRTRTASVLASHGGKACPPRTSYQVCNTKICRCAHIRCHFALHSATGRTRIRVTHDADEFMGRKHKCGYNYQNQSCECRCFDHMVQKPAGFFNVLPVAAADQIRTTAGNTYKTAAWLRHEPRGIPGIVLKRNEHLEHLRTQPQSSESALEEAAP
jgi:hypothetical protein